jgi:hypothetical protein
MFFPFILRQAQEERRDFLLFKEFNTVEIKIFVANCKSFVNLKIGTCELGTSVVQTYPSWVGKHGRSPVGLVWKEVGQNLVLSLL